MKEIIEKFGFFREGNRVYSGTDVLTLELEKGEKSEKDKRVVKISFNGESDKLIELSLCIIIFNKWAGLTCHGSKSFLLKVAQKVIPVIGEDSESNSLKSATFVKSTGSDFSETDSDLKIPEATPHQPTLPQKSAEDEEEPDDDQTPGM